MKTQVKSIKEFIKNSLENDLKPVEKGTTTLTIKRPDGKYLAVINVIKLDGDK